MSSVPIRQKIRKGRLVLDRDICRHGPGNIFEVCWNQWRTERALAQRGIRFRQSDPHEVRAAYSAMTEREFQAINGRQNWANWRTIPRALSGLLPNRPWTIVDLGCGTGDSTRVLACCAPAGSRILGYELAEPLLEIARLRAYRNRHGEEIAAEFHCQPITESLLGPDGVIVPAGSIDVANASGVVGQHLDRESAARLAHELRRALKPDGVAALDVGPSLPHNDLTAVMRAAGFARLRFRKSSLLDQTGQVVFRPQAEAVLDGSRSLGPVSAARRIMQPLFARNS